MIGKMVVDWPPWLRRCVAGIDIAHYDPELPLHPAWDPEHVALRNGVGWLATLNFCGIPRERWPEAVAIIGDARHDGPPSARALLAGFDSVFGADGGDAPDRSAIARPPCEGDAIDRVQTTSLWIGHLRAMFWIADCDDAAIVRDLSAVGRMSDMSAREIMGYHQPTEHGTDIPVIMSGYPMYRIICPRRKPHEGGDDHGA